ncbi:hypothetical protein MTO96_008458 [Rhipicephalus appendiculatus]
MDQWCEKEEVNATEEKRQFVAVFRQLQPVCLNSNVLGNDDKESFLSLCYELLSHLFAKPQQQQDASELGLSILSLLSDILNSNRFADATRGIDEPPF